jgi:hypothetical protein
MREQLQKLIDVMKQQHSEMLAVGNNLGLVCAIFHNTTIHELEAILAANPEPAVRLRAGWVCKDREGLSWHTEKPWCGTDHYYDNARHSVWVSNSCPNYEDCFTDPWPDKPNGGPECLMEVN